MSEEVIEESRLVEIQQLYKLKLEERRRNIKWNDEIRHVFGTQSPQNGNVDAIAVLDEWFLKQCDGNQEAKKYLSFYYDCIKNGRYDKILERILRNRKNYEGVCVFFLKDSELLKDWGGLSSLHLDLGEIVDPLSTFNSIEEEHWFEEWTKFQDSIAQILFDHRFHLNLIILGFSMSCSHPFLVESWMSHEFGVLDDDKEIPNLVQELEFLMLEPSYTPEGTHIYQNPRWELKILMDDFSDLVEVKDSTSILEYESYLTEVIGRIKNILLKHNEIYLELIFPYLFMTQVPFDILSQLWSDPKNKSSSSDFDDSASKDESKQLLSDEIYTKNSHHKDNIAPQISNLNDQTDFSYFASNSKKGEMLAFINPRDYMSLFTLSGRNAQPITPLYCQTRDCLTSASKIHTLYSILPFHAAIVKKGSFALINLLSGFKKKTSNSYLCGKDIYHKFEFWFYFIGPGNNTKSYYRNTPPIYK